jgi:hypothetical protein
MKVAPIVEPRQRAAEGRLALRGRARRAAWRRRGRRRGNPPRRAVLSGRDAQPVAGRGRCRPAAPPGGGARTKANTRAPPAASSVAQAASRSGRRGPRTSRWRWFTARPRRGRRSRPRPASSAELHERGAGIVGDAALPRGDHLAWRVGRDPLRRAAFGGSRCPRAPDTAGRWRRRRDERDAREPRRARGGTGRRAAEGLPMRNADRRAADSSRMGGSTWRSLTYPTFMARAKSSAA